MKWDTKSFIGGTSGMKIKHSILRNAEGFIVACLYILPDGNLHADSWLRSEGWGNK